MQLSAERFPRVVSYILILVSAANCTTQADRDVRAADEARRYKLAQQAWETSHAAATSPATTLAGNAAGAVRGQVTIAGVEVEAARVIFVIDATGSMMETFDRLRSEVKNAIVAMPATLRFNIVIFAGDGLTMLSPAYVVSNDVGKRDAQDFLDRTAPHGASDPLQAVRAALAAAPDAIFLITDGDLPDGRRLLDEIRKGNAGKKICINTIVTAQSDDYDKLLRQIAEENGGGFSHLGG